MEVCDDHGIPPFDIADPRSSHTKKFWHESRTNRNHRLRRTPRLDLLGYPVNDFNPLEPRWVNHIRVSENPWLADYKRKDDVVLSPASMLCAVLEAGRQLAESNRHLKGFDLRDVLFGDPPVVPAEHSGIGMFLQIRRHRNGIKVKDSAWQEFTMYSEKNDNENIEHCSGLFQIQYQLDDPGADTEGIAEVQAMANEYARYQAKCKRSVKPADFYEGWKSRNMRWGRGRLSGNSYCG